jgi:hypothetical protein
MQRNVRCFRILRFYGIQVRQLLAVYAFEYIIQVF